jgi:hypothetical protein
MQLPKGLHHLSKACHLHSRVHYTHLIWCRRFLCLRHPLHSLEHLRLGVPDLPGPPDLLALLYHLRVEDLGLNPDSPGIRISNILSLTLRPSPMVILMLLSPTNSPARNHTSSEHSSPAVSWSLTTSCENSSTNSSVSPMQHPTSATSP